MKHSELKARASEVRAAFDAQASLAPKYADPSWFAHRGYISAAGESGAGHLAWERIAPELLRLRTTYARLGRPFRDRELAFVMAYGLGLTDSGTLSHADAEELADSILPSGRGVRPLYRAPLFWMMTMLVVLLDISVALAIAVETPEYPTLSAPLDYATPIESSQELEEDAADTKPAEPAGLTNDAPAPGKLLSPIRNALQGTGTVDAAVTALSRLSEGMSAQLAQELYSGLEGAEQVALVKALGDLPGTEISNLIRRAFHSVDSDVVLAAIGASVSRGDRLAHIGLTSLLGHVHIPIRLRSLEALSIVGIANDAHAILPCLGDERTHAAARAALKAILGVDRGKKARQWRRYLHWRASRNAL